MISVFDLFRLDGSVCVVTGAHAWLGWDMACALAEAGCHTVVTSRNLERAEKTATKLHNMFPLIDTLGVNMDQRFYKEVTEMIERVIQWKGKIDILVNNAGGGVGDSEGDILKRSPEDAENLIQTNLIGVLHCCQQVAKVMIKQKKGNIVNIASMAGLIGRDRRMYQRSHMKGQPIDYAAAKAGVIGSTRDLAGFLGPYGIRVNAISPGGFDKGVLPQRFVNDFADATILGRWGRMGIDLKGAILYLATEASAYVTGHNLVVDGGFSIFK